MAKIHPIFDTLPDGVVSINTHHVITYVNMSFLTMSGYSENDLIGKELNVVIPREFHSNHTRHINKFDKRDTNVRPMSFGGEQTFPLLTKDKKRLSVIITINKNQVDGSPGYSAVVRPFHQASIPLKTIPAVIEKTTKSMVETSKTINKKEEKVLIVDDDPFILKYLKYILSDYTVISKLNAIDALSCLAEESIDLIISDVKMPVLNGFSFLKKLKEENNTKSIPFVFLAGDDEEENKIIALKEGAEYYLTKPVNSEEIKIVARNLLHKSQDYRIEKLTRNISVEINANIQDEERTFLQNYSKTIDKYLSDPEFSASTLAKLMNMNRRTLERRIKRLTGISPLQSIILSRMNSSRRIKKLNPTLSNEDLAGSVGYTDVKYFMKSFKKVFGMKPEGILKHK